MAKDKDGSRDGKEWGFVAYNVADAPKCIARCRRRFIEAILAASAPRKDYGDDETFDQVCETLSDKTQRDRKDQPFWDLYCCDAQLCGVNNVERLGEDPNINWIINTCSNIGFESVLDPGPPDATYTCSHEAVHGKDRQCQRLKEASPTTTSDVFLIDAIATDTMVPSITRGMSDSTISSIVDPSLTASTVANDSDQSDRDRDLNLSTGEKIAIAVSVVAGLVIFVAILFCLFRIRALRKKRSRSGDTDDHGSIFFPHASSLSPSTPPPSLHGSDGAPLTPPLRLKERRLLPSGHSARSWSPSASIRKGSGFPESPLHCPMKTKLIPRREEMKKAAGSQTAPLLSNLGWIREDGSIRSGNSSYTGGSSTHSERMRSGFDDKIVTRHVRHPSRIHSLASPGPAPNKKLPPTPVESVHSRTLSPSRHGDVGVAIGVVNHNPASGVTLAGPSRDLCELTEEYEREARHSGGSWSGKGGGGPGVALTSPKKTHLASPKSKLGEDDLQRMGGGY